MDGPLRVDLLWDDRKIPAKNEKQYFFLSFSYNLWIECKQTQAKIAQN